MIRPPAGQTRKIAALTCVLGCVGAVLGIASATGTIGGHADSQSAGPHAYTPIEFRGNREFIIETLADVGRHVDAIVLATPVSESEISAEIAIERGEGVIGRRIDVRIDQVLWARQGSERLPAIIETAGGSWQYRDGQRTPLFYFGELGRQYLFVLRHNDDPSDTNGYAWMHDATLEVPFVNGRTPAVINSEKPYFAAIRGKTSEELARLFAQSLG